MLDRQNPLCGVPVVVLAAGMLLLSAGHATAGVTTVGAVSPVPPPAGGTFTSQLVVGAGSDDTSNDIFGWVSVDNGTTLQYGSLVVGDNDGFFGEVDVSGNFLGGINTKLNFSAIGGTTNPTVQIGNEGSGTLNVRGGSTMTLTNQSGDMSIGFNTTGVGYATITDPFTILTVPDFFFVGQSGIGTLRVLNGALARTLNTSSSRFIGIGTNNGSVGTVVVDGQGSVLRAGNNLVVSGNAVDLPTQWGQGLLQINNGAIVDVDNTTGARVIVGPLGRIELKGGTLVSNSLALPSYGTTVHGYLGGSGLVRGTVFLSGDASLEANAGDVLRFDGDVESQGAITINSGEVRFLAGFDNNAPAGPIPPGRITLEDGTVRFTEPLLNNGVISSAHGATNIHGQITNQGEIVVARDTVATFNDAVNNTTGTITVLPGGNALFLTDLSFLGLGALDLGVGVNNLINSQGQVRAGGSVSLAGELTINVEGGYSPTLGDTFQLLTANDGITGTFDTTTLPDIPGDLEYALAYSPTSVKLEVRSESTSAGGLPGDYNLDGTVDAADYSVWRDKLGSSLALPNDDTAGVGQDDYERWKTHFGESAVFGAGAGDAANRPAPEPATLLLLAAPVALLPMLRRR